MNMEKILYKELSYQIQGAAIEARKNFGPGHKEILYQNALAEELTSRGIHFEREKSIPVRSPKTGKVMGSYKPDFVVEDKVVVELKALDKIPRGLVDQLYDYLKNSEYELGYFINFSAPKLFMKRIIFTNDRKFKRGVGAEFVGLCLIFVVLGVGVLFGRARAASIKVYFSAPTEVALGQEFSVRLLVDSDQPLNAYSLSWSFPVDKLELMNTSNANSIIGVWQNQPTVSISGLIKFDGGSFEAFSGSGGELLSATFKALAEGEAELNFGDTAVFLANGKGTKVTPLKEDLKIYIKKAGEIQFPIDSSSTALRDGEPPVIELLSVERDPFNEKQKLLGFLVKDSGSGIKEVRARFRLWFFWSDWQTARNPTAVPVSAWSVGFWAADNKGNTVERTIYDWGAFARLAAIVGAVVLVLVLVLLYWRRGRGN